MHDTAINESIFKLFTLISNDWRESMRLITVIFMYIRKKNCWKKKLYFWNNFVLYLHVYDNKQIQLNS